MVPSVQLKTSRDMPNKVKFDPFTINSDFKITFKLKETLGFPTKESSFGYKTC